MNDQYKIEIDFEYIEFSKENDLPKLREELIKLFRENRIAPLQIFFRKKKYEDE